MGAENGGHKVQQHPGEPDKSGGGHAQHPKSAAAKINEMMETVVTSQKILANSIAHQTQALKELRSCSQNEFHRDERK